MKPREESTPTLIDALVRYLEEKDSIRREVTAGKPQRVLSRIQLNNLWDK